MPCRVLPADLPAVAVTLGWRRAHAARGDRKNGGGVSNRGRARRVPTEHEQGASPPLARDPWAWAALLGVAPLVLHSLGAPLGEPFADDFDYLRHELLEGGGSFFDGGGSTLWLRALARQVYCRPPSSLILARPGLVYAFRLLLLCIASVLL